MATDIEAEKTFKFSASAGTLALALSSGLGDGVAAAPRRDPQIQGGKFEN